jgi:hypothetical protein
MSDEGETNQAEELAYKKLKNARTILLLLAIITSPLICCGGIYLLNAIPNSPLPTLFRGEAQVENLSGETLYLTAITTTYGDPRVITQSSSFRQRNIPVHPNRSIVLTYDTADTPLDGIAVCREDEECRLLDTDYSADEYVLNSFETLPKLDQSWLLAIQSYPRYNIYLVVVTASALSPIAFFVWWLYLGRKIKQEGNKTL